MKRLNDARVLMYSHDTFGLGHLRRCRTIAHALVERHKGLSVLIISGSPIAGAFDFKARVDFVKIPSVIKLYNGEYTSIDRHIDLADTLAMRSSVIQFTAKSFDPDILIVDKEPLGLKGELESTLRLLRTRGTRLVLGLRDVMDAPHLLQAEWEPKQMIERIDELYDQIWVYGPEGFNNPLSGLNMPESVEARLAYTGFLERSVPSMLPFAIRRPARNSLLVTAGGGGDGMDLMNQVLAAYEYDRSIPTPLIMVLGPFMAADAREALHKRALAAGRVTVVDFDSRIEPLMKSAAGVVGMCGYNTFCEVMSFDQRALMVPRVSPREEQLIRASRACELGLVDMLLPSEADDPARMAAALKALPNRARPSQVGVDIHLDGLDRIAKLVREQLRLRASPNLAAATG